MVTRRNIPSPRKLRSVSATLAESYGSPALKRISRLMTDSLVMMCRPLATLAYHLVRSAASKMSERSITTACTIGGEIAREESTAWAETVMGANSQSHPADTRRRRFSLEARITDDSLMERT